MVCAEYERERGALVRHALLRAAVELARALGCYKVTALRPAPAPAHEHQHDTDATVPPSPNSDTVAETPPTSPELVAAHVDAAFDLVGIKPDLDDYHMLLFVPK